MSYLVYNLLFTLAFLMGLPFFFYKMIFQGRYRTGIKERFGFLPENFPLKGDDEWIWIHGVSVGEVNVASVIIEALRRFYPKLKILLTVTTDTGRALAETKRADAVIFFPLDFPGNADCIMKRLRPCCALLMETEIWPNFLKSAQKFDCKVFLINGRISDNSFKGYFRFRKFMKKVLGKFYRFLMQSGDDCSKIVKLGAPPDKVKLIGNLKYDGVLQRIEKVEKNDWRRRLGIQNDQPVFIAGSLHGRENEWLVDVYSRLREKIPGLFFIIAPRHLKRVPEIQESLKTKNIEFTLKSEMPREPDANRTGSDETARNVIILDTMGELAAAYQAGDAAFVGGSLVPHGGQNILEPAAFSLPVLFGPHMYNFKESAALLKDRGAAFEIKNENELYERLLELFQDEGKRKKAGEAGRQAIYENRGAVRRCLDELKTALPYGPERTGE